MRLLSDRRLTHKHGMPTMPRLKAVPLFPALLHQASQRVVQSPSLFFAARFSLPSQITVVPSRFSLGCTRALSTTLSKKTEKPVWPYLYKPFDKMAHLDSVFKEVDNLQETFIQRLKEAVGIPSISSEDDRRQDVVKVGGTVLVIPGI